MNGILRQGHISQTIFDIVIQIPWKIGFSVNPLLESNC